VDAHHDRGADVRPLRSPTTVAAYFGPAHVLADVAARNCAPHHSPLIGGDACGACWERAVRDDERFAAEFDLPRDVAADPDDVDEIAVDLACRGEDVALTAAEFAAAVARMRGRQLGPMEIARRLRCTYDAVAAASTTTVEEAA